MIMTDNKTVLYSEYLKKQHYDYWGEYRDQFYKRKSLYKDKLELNGLLTQIVKPKPIKSY